MHPVSGVLSKIGHCHKSQLPVLAINCGVRNGKNHYKLQKDQHASIRGNKGLQKVMQASMEL